MIGVMTIYTVFEKLENYYNDDDSTYVISFNNEKDANDYVAKYPQYNYYVKSNTVYTSVNNV